MSTPEWSHLTYPQQPYRVHSDTRSGPRVASQASCKRRQGADVGSGDSEPFVGLRQSPIEVEVTGSSGGPVEGDEASPLEEAVEAGGGQVGVVKDASPLPQGLVGREDHGPAPEVPVVHDVVEHVRGIGPVGEVADLVDHEHVGMGVGGEGVVEATLLGGRDEDFDELGRGGEERLEPFCMAR